MMRHILVAALGACIAMAALPATAQTANPQQERMKACNSQAGKITGDARRQFMSQCLSGKPAAEKPLNSQQQKMKDCNASASAAKLSGAQRRQFMSTCLKGSSGQ